MSSFRLVLAATLCLLLSACVQVRRTIVEPVQSVAEELFDRGMAELASSGETTYFETLHREYPASPWASRAQAVVDLLQARATRANGEVGRQQLRADQAEGLVAQLDAEVARLEAALAEVGAERDRLASERGSRAAEGERLRAEGARMLEDLARVHADNARLLDDLEKLKNLTIEMELKR